MKFTAVVVAHGNEHLTNMMIAQLVHSQSRKPDEILVAISDTKTDRIMELPFLKNTVLKFLHRDDLGDWGHDKRRAGLAEATGDYVGFFNHDDVYHSDYIKEMMTIAIGTDSDIVISNWMEEGWPRTTEMKYCGMTAGAYIVRTGLAQKVGYNHNHYEADNQFILDLVDAGAKYALQPDHQLYTHL